MRDYGYENDVNARRALRGKGPVVHVDDVERAEWADDELVEVVPRPWVVSDDDRARMSQQERLDHPENAG